MEGSKRQRGSPGEVEGYCDPGEGTANDEMSVGVPGIQTTHGRGLPPPTLSHHRLPSMFQYQNVDL